MADPYLALYQGLSKALPAGARPRDLASPKQFTSAEDAPRLTAWVQGNRAIAGEATFIQARLADAQGRPVTPDTANIFVFDERYPKDGVRARMVPAGASARGELRFEFVGAPSRLGDATPSGSETPAPAHFGYLVHVTGELEGHAFARQALGWFFVHSPGGALDPATAGVAKDGEDMVVRVWATVARAGKYWVAAELWGGPAGDLPIASASHPLGLLEAGRHELTLTFGGQILRDRSVDGPYTVRNVILEQVDTVPPHRSQPLVRLDTPPYLAGEFGHVPPAQ